MINVSDPAKETQRKSSLLGVFTRSCTWLTLKEWETDYSLNLVAKVWNKSNGFAFFVSNFVILITQYVHVLDFKAQN